MDIYTDGSSLGNPGPSGASALAFRGERLVDILFENLGRATTNNVAEYRGLLLALELAAKHCSRGDTVRVYTDSKLVLSQVKGLWAARAPHLASLRDQVLSEIGKLDARVDIRHVRAHRGVLNNELADTVARLAAGCQQTQKKGRKRNG